VGQYIHAGAIPMSAGASLKNSWPRNKNYNSKKN